MNIQVELQAERSRTREAEAALKVAVEENLGLKVRLEVLEAAADA